jgi:glyoxylase-like metal-dependent hydrolase (beta-lactamase superfamily II)
VQGPVIDGLSSVMAQETTIVGGHAVEANFNQQSGINMKIYLLAAVVIGLGLLPNGASAQTPERQVIEDAAQALGGRDRVMSVNTLLVEGAGHEMNVGQSLRYDELGLLSDVAQIRDYKRAYDLRNGRARFEATRQLQYPYYQGDAAARQIQALDGAIAFNVGPNGTPTRVFPQAQINARRVEFLRHPLTIVRTALLSGATLANSRTRGSERLVDITSGGVTLTMAIDGTTRLPARVTYITDSPTLGDTPISTEFADYKTVSGLQLPTRITTKTDRWLSADIRILKQSVDADVGNLAAPANIASATPQANAGQPPSAPTVAQEIAKGVWFVTGTTHHSLLVEFSDHLMLIEAPNNERTLAVLAKAKELRPNKPVTVLLVTHHHGDHTSGVRTALAEAPIREIITHRSNVAYLNDVINRPHTINPDALSKKPGAKAAKITAIDDQGVVKDSTMTINLYHVLDNTHADSMLMIYFPNGRILTEADIYMPNDARNIIAGEPLGHAPWNQNLMGNINLRKLQVDNMAPIHGEYTPFSLFIENTIAMTQYAPGTEPNAASQ